MSIGVVDYKLIIFFNLKNILLYESLIRPHLEYANVIWYHKYQSISVERVQRRATELLMETRHMTHSVVGIFGVAFLMVEKT